MHNHYTWEMVMNINLKIPLIMRVIFFNRGILHSLFIKFQSVKYQTLLVSSFQCPWTADYKGMTKGATVYALSS